jgi:hypothetical protein
MGKLWKIYENQWSPLYWMNSLDRRSAKVLRQASRSQTTCCLKQWCLYCYNAQPVWSSYKKTYTNQLSMQLTITARNFLSASAIANNTPLAVCGHLTCVKRFPRQLHQFITRSDFSQDKSWSPEIPNTMTTLFPTTCSGSKNLGPGKGPLKFWPTAIS